MHLYPRSRKIFLNKSVSLAPILTQQTPQATAPVEVRKPQSIYDMDKDVVRMDLEESRYVTKQVTVRKMAAEQPDVYNARNK